MNRGYDSPGVDVFRSEEINTPITAGKVIYGIVGLTTKGPYGYTTIKNIRQLHDIFGYAFLGEDENGERIISDAIIAAEHTLSNTDEIIFTRVSLSATQNAKFKRTSADKLKFTISNNDATVKSVTIHHDGEYCVVTVGKVRVDGAVDEKELCSVTTEVDLKKALEYDGTLTDVTVPEGYFDSIKPTETVDPETGERTITYHDDVYAPNVDVFDYNLTTEIETYANKDAVNVQVLAAPMGSVLEIGLSTLEDKEAAYQNINNQIIATVRERGSNSSSSDCCALLDYPKGLKYADAKRLFTSPWWKALDEQQVLVAYPTVTVQSVYTKDIVELLSSVIWLDRMAFTDTKMYPWIAPAGYGNKKGVIPGVVSVGEVLTKEMRDELNALKVNSIVKFVGKGVVLFGNRTFKTGTPYEDPSLFEKVNVVRLANYITRVGYDISLDVLFDPNDKTTWEQWTARMTTEMEKIKVNRGVEQYIVRMDEETVTDSDKMMDRAPAIVYILPIGAVEYIPIHLTLTDNREVFGEEE